MTATADVDPTPENPTPPSVELTGRCKRPRSSPHPATRSFRATVPTREEYEANVLSLRRELGALEREPTRPPPPPPNGVQVAARLGLSVAEWGRARQTFPPGATWRDIKRELYRRITAGEPTGVATVKTLDDIPAF